MPEASVVRRLSGCHLDLRRSYGPGVVIQGGRSSFAPSAWGPFQETGGRAVAVHPRTARRSGAVLGIATATVLLTSGVGVNASHLDDPPNPAAPIDDPIPGHVADGAIQLELQTVSEGLTAPNWGTHAPGAPSTVLFVADQPGPLWAVDTTTGAKRIVLDTSSLLVP